MAIVLRVAAVVGKDAARQFIGHKNTARTSRYNQIILLGSQ